MMSDSITSEYDALVLKAKRYREISYGFLFSIIVIPALVYYTAIFDSLGQWQYSLYTNLLGMAILGVVLALIGTKLKQPNYVFWTLIGGIVVLYLFNFLISFLGGYSLFESYGAYVSFSFFVIMWLGISYNIFWGMRIKKAGNKKENRDALNSLVLGWSGFSFGLMIFFVTMISIYLRIMFWNGF